MKVGFCTYFVGSECHIIGSNYPFILDIVFTVDNSDYLSCKYFKRFINSKNIRILLLTVGRDNTLDVSVIYRIYHIWIIGVCGAEWAVNFDRYHFGQHKSILRKSIFGAVVDGVENIALGYEIFENVGKALVSCELIVHKNDKRESFFG